MDIEVLKKACQSFLNDHFGDKATSIIVESDNEDVYCTLHKWNYDDDQIGEISLWCSDGWITEDKSIKEDDIVFWLCLERYSSVRKGDMENYLSKEYRPYYDKKFDEDGAKLIREKSLFIQTYFTLGKAKNTIYISYCFKKNKLNYEDELSDFFQQIINGNLVSEKETNELKASILGKFIKTTLNLKAVNLIRKWWENHKDDAEIQQIINSNDFIYQEQKNKLSEWLNADIDSEKIEPLSRIPNPTKHQDSELEAEIVSLSESEKKLLIQTIETIKEKSPIKLDLYSNKVPLARALSRYKLGKEVGDSAQRVFDFCLDPTHLIPLNDKKREMACSILKIEKTDGALLRFFDELSLENAVCVNPQNQTRLYGVVLWHSLNLKELIESANVKRRFWIAGTSFGGGNQIDALVENHYWEGGECDTLSNIRKVRKDDILIANTSSTKGPGHKTPFIKVFAVGVVKSDMVNTKERPDWYRCDVDWVRISPEVDFDGNEYGKYRKTMQECSDKLLKLKNFALEKLNMDLIPVVQEKSEYAKLLLANYNIILHGAPGTGKTYLAKQIAKEIGAEYEMIQFHQSFDYTDFVEGIRPAKGENGKADGFEHKDGVFKVFCKKAIETTKIGVTDNFEESFQKIVAKLETDNVIQIPLISGKGNFYIALNSDGDGFVTMLKDEDSGKFTRDTTRFFNYEQCYNVYRGLPGTPKKGFDNYRKAIVKYMKDTLGLKEYQEGENTETSQSKKFVFIIDEINRGEMSKIFGELFFSIDPGYRGEVGRIKTQYQNLVPEGDAFEKGFYVPENVYIIGTMNDIDRSVESMDFAMRRRFAFKEITADERIEMLDSLKCGKKSETVKCMQALNKEIESISGLSSAYHIGPAYFLKLDNYQGNFGELWKYHIEGVLREYLRGMPKAADHLNKLKECYDKSIASESSVSSDNVGDSVENF